jgi:negative regulator of sigma E activity
MSEDFENQLRRAMRPVQPTAGFAERVMRALPERRAPATVVPLNIVRKPAPVSAWRRFSAPAALAASLFVAVIAGTHVAHRNAEREEQAGLAASRELMQALRVTSQKLDLAYDAVQRPAPAPAADEENRS